MSAQHTPGPWVVGNDETQFGVKRGNGMEPLGFVYCPAFAERSEVGQRAIANARLIAAAPDLLAAILEALEFAEDQEDVVDGPDGVPQANKAMQLAQSLRAVIAKAEAA